MSNISRSEDLSFQINDIEDYSISIFKLQGLKLYILISFLAMMAFLGIIGKSMIVYYIQKYSPKEQSINKLILVDQVCNPQHTQQTFNRIKKLSKGPSQCERAYIHWPDPGQKARLPRWPFLWPLI